MSIEHPTSEVERNELVDRDNFRRVVQRQAELLIATVFDTPPTGRVDESLLVNRLLDGVWPEITAFRKRNLERFTKRLQENSGKLS